MGRLIQCVKVIGNKHMHISIEDLMENTEVDASATGERYACTALDLAAQ